MLAGLLLLLAPLLFLWASSGRLLLHTHALSFRDEENLAGQAHLDHAQTPLRNNAHVTICVICMF